MREKFMSKSKMQYRLCMIQMLLLFMIPVTSKAEIKFLDYSDQGHIYSSPIPLPNVLHEKRAIQLGALIERFKSIQSEEGEKENFKAVQELSLAKNYLDDSTFMQLTDAMPENQDSFVNLVVLDLTTNQLTEASVNSLLKWYKRSMDKNRTLKSEFYINLANNYSIALHNVNKLSEGFKELFRGEDPNGYQEKHQEIMRHMIFMSRQYIGKASRDVRVYKQYITESLIPEDWAKIHRDYYALDVLKTFGDLQALGRYCQFRKELELIAMQTVPTRKSSIPSEETQETEEQSGVQEKEEICVDRSLELFLSPQ